MDREKKIYDIIENEDIDVKEYPLENGLKGIYDDRLIILKKDMNSLEARCVLAEEVGHHLLTVGDITDQTIISNRKQERLARKWAYNTLLPADLIREKIEAGVTEPYELAEALEVTEHFLRDALELYFTNNKLEKKIINE